MWMVMIYGCRHRSSYLHIYLAKVILFHHIFDKCAYEILLKVLKISLHVTQNERMKRNDKIV
jgi:hypothetical protein